MIAFLRRRPVWFLGGRWCVIALLAIFMVGCARWKVRDEGFGRNELSDMARKARPSGEKLQYSSLSEKGREIERDLHAQ